MTIVTVLSVLVVCASFIAPAALADVKLPKVIDSHMVLQRDMPLPIWGWAEPGEAVTVKLAGHEASTKADKAGKWMVKLPSMPAGGPHAMQVVGKNTIELTDILVGEVWICSGQSNMEMGINSINNAEAEVAAANYPNIRLLQLPWKVSIDPADDVDAQWRMCDPKGVSSGGFWGVGFSAVAYFFGRDIHKDQNVPVGLIDTSWGGTRIEPWTPPIGFKSVATLQDIVKAVDEATPNYNRAAAKALTEYEAWLPKAKQSLEAGDRVPAPSAWPKHLFEDQGQPTSIYNGMIHPLVPFAIRGAIWYQGESNRPDGMAYYDKMKALINGWRTVWGQGDFPFYFTQLAPYRYGKDQHFLLPGIWEAQTASLSIPNTGMAVTVDIGDVSDIHPRNKQDVGKRLALWALAKTYGRKDLVYSGPLYKSMSVGGGKIVLRFDHVGGGLASRDDKPLTWFEIAGADKKFVKAAASIAGDTIIVTSDEVAEPVAVRFGWHELAEPNLMNKEGLPASPFRTDKW